MYRSFGRRNVTIAATRERINYIGCKNNENHRDLRGGHDVIGRYPYELICMLMAYRRSGRFIMTCNRRLDRRPIIIIIIIILHAEGTPKTALYNIRVEPVRHIVYIYIYVSTIICYA